MAGTRSMRIVAYAWIGILAVLMAGPVLLPGFALSYDLVFTPRQDLLPASIGVGGGLPRAAPQDAVVALVELVVPGAWLEKGILLAIPILVGTGMMRLLPGTGAGVVAATVAVANPYVAQRLVIGHWGLLLAYALVPWALIVARRLRAGGDPWDGLRLILLVAAGSLTPSGSLLISALAVPPALLPGSAYAPGRRVALAAAVVATWLPWLLPALLHPIATASDPQGSGVFALRADTPGGPVLSALSGGGIWNAEVVLPSRGTALSLLLTVVMLALAAWGARPLVAAVGRCVTTWWALAAAVGLTAALASNLAPVVWSGLLDAVPGAGLARDAQKLLAPWVLLVAAAAGVGAARLASRLRDRTAASVLLVALAVLPLACQPDLLGGAGGRLSAVEYPGDWSVVREALAVDGRSGDVASFPWASFRRFAWNDQRTVLDPAPRWLPRTTVVADDLVVSTPQGDVVVSGDDPRAQAISEALKQGQDVAGLLPDLGIGWALVTRDTPGPVPELPGWERVTDTPTLTLYAAPPGTVAPTRPEVRLVAAVDLLVAMSLLAGAAGLGIRRVRARRPRPLVA